MSLAAARFVQALAQCTNMTPQTQILTCLSRACTAPTAISLVQIYDTQRQLERESQLLKAELAALKQQLGSWSNTTQQLVEGLKHAGDLEHYVAVLSREAAALAKVLTAAAAAEAQTEAAAAGQATEDAGTLEVGSQQDSAAGLAATAATGGGQQAGAAQSSTPQQSEASLDLPVSKRASR